MRISRCPAGRVWHQSAAWERGHPARPTVRATGKFLRVAAQSLPPRKTGRMPVLPSRWSGGGIIILRAGHFGVFAKRSQMMSASRFEKRVFQCAGTAESKSLFYETKPNVVGRDCWTRRRRCAVWDKRRAQRSRPTGDCVVSVSAGLRPIRRRSHPTPKTAQASRDGQNETDSHKNCLLGPIHSHSIRPDPTESDPKNFAELTMNPPTHCKCTMAVAAPAMATHHALARSWSGQGSRNAHGGERTIHQENQPVAITMQSLRSFFPVLSPSMRNKRNILSEETRFTCWHVAGRDRRARHRRCVVEDKRRARRLRSRRHSESRPTGNCMVTCFRPGSHVSGKEAKSHSRA